MARAKIVHAILDFWCCFYQHQSSARTTPGADRRVYEWSSTGSGLKFLARSKVTQFCSVRNMTSMYMGMFSFIPWQLSLIWPSSWMGPRKSSAALLSCEHNFYCLVRTKSGGVTERGISLSEGAHHNCCTAENWFNPESCGKLYYNNVFCYGLSDRNPQTNKHRQTASILWHMEKELHGLGIYYQVYNDHIAKYLILINSWNYVNGNILMYTDWCILTDV